MKGCFYAYVAIKSLSPPVLNRTIFLCNRAMVHRCVYIVLNIKLLSSAHFLFDIALPLKITVRPYFCAKSTEFVQKWCRCKDLYVSSLSA